MIGKCHFLFNLHTQLFQGGEEAWGMTDTGHCHYTRQFDCRAALTAGNINRVTCLQPHGNLTRLGHTTVGNQSINAV